LDDELNVLPISKGKDITPIDEGRGKGKVDSELKDLKESLADMKPVGELVKLAKTLDQAQAILTFVDAISEKTLSSTVTLTAARGRGKSAALGLAIAAALAHGYSNIFVTSPSPENLKTLFDFIFKGMDALGYEEHLDYDIVQSTNPDFNNAIVRVNIFRQHRQTIQVSPYLISYCTVTDSLCSTSNLKMHTYWVKQNSSSLMKQQLYLCPWSGISWDLTLSSWHPQSTATKALAVHSHLNSSSNSARAHALHSRKTPPL
jgi:uncharacterized membrane protein